MSVRTDAVRRADGAAQILRSLRELFAPDAIDSISQDMVKSLYFERAGQNLETYLL